jgi:hypothetical protein
MNRLKGIIYEMIGWLATKGRRRSAMNKRLLIVRIDEIGDYMLWRPFFESHCTIPIIQEDMKFISAVTKAGKACSIHLMHNCNGKFLDG